MDSSKVILSLLEFHVSILQLATCMINCVIQLIRESSLAELKGSVVQRSKNLE